MDALQKTGSTVHTIVLTHMTPAIAKTLTGTLQALRSGSSAPITLIMSKPALTVRTQPLSACDVPRITRQLSCQLGRYAFKLEILECFYSLECWLDGTLAVTPFCLRHALPLDWYACKLDSLSVE